MELIRISHKRHAKKLSSSGFANRWNLDGEFVLYTSASRSLATLELLVHRNSVTPIPDFEVMIISIADDDALVEQVKLNALPKNWRSFEAYHKLQKIGSEWYQSQRSLVLKIPSAVIPKEHNYLINTNHPDFKKCVSLVRNEAYFFDERLFV